MNSAFHIDPLSSPAGDGGTTASEFWGTDLAFRIWLWLSQIYAGYARAPQSPLAQLLLGSTFLRDPYSPFQIAAAQLNCQECHCGQCETVSAQETDRATPRHRRRMTARRKRGIMPITRYTGDFLRPLLPRGLTRTQYIEAVLRISPLGRLQCYDWNYHRHEFFRRGAIKARAAMGRVCAQLGALCHAPLCLD